MTITHPGTGRTGDIPGDRAVVRGAVQRQVGGYLDHLAVERGLAANTLGSYRRDLRRYAAHLRARDIASLQDVTEPDVATFLMALREGDEQHPPLAAGSAARAVIAVRGLHRFAVREGMARTDPARDVRPPERTPRGARCPV